MKERDSSHQAEFFSHILEVSPSHCRFGGNLRGLIAALTVLTANVELERLLDES